MLTRPQQLRRPDSANRSSVVFLQSKKATCASALWSFAKRSLPGRLPASSAMLVLPLDAVVGLEVRDEMVEDSRVINGLEMDIVKCFRTGIGRREVLRRIARKER